MMETKVRKPSVRKFKESLDRKTEAWIMGTARPYLESLLQAAQARMPRHVLEFNDGMGMSTIYVSPERQFSRLSDAVEAVAYSCEGSMAGRWRQLVNARDRRYAERFPELVQFMIFVQEIDSEIGHGWIGPIPAPGDPPQE